MRDAHLSIERTAARSGNTNSSDELTAALDQIDQSLDPLVIQAANLFVGDLAQMFSALYIKVRAKVARPETQFQPDDALMRETAAFIHAVNELSFAEHSFQRIFQLTHTRMLQRFQHEAHEFYQKLLQFGAIANAAESEVTFDASYEIRVDGKDERETVGGAAVTAAYTHGIRGSFKATDLSSKQVVQYHGFNVQLTGFKLGRLELSMLKVSQCC